MLDFWKAHCRANAAVHRQRHHRLALTRTASQFSRPVVAVQWPFLTFCLYNVLKLRKNFPVDVLRFALSTPYGHHLTLVHVQPSLILLHEGGHVSSFTLNKFTSQIGSSAGKEAELGAALLFVGWHTLQMVVASGPDFIYMHIYPGAVCGDISCVVLGTLESLSHMDKLSAPPGCCYGGRERKWGDRVGSVLALKTT